jgi:two-component system, OmpR family, response regulator ChvI
MNMKIFSLFIVVQEISFTGDSQNYCICYIDIVDSTRNTFILDPEKTKRYYSVFINIMAAMARDFNSIVIKNTGDSLVYYFPETSDSANTFKRVLEFGLTMIAVHPIINTKLNEEGLPSLDYRISADYGRADVAQSLTTTSEDLFGPTVNICAKINSIAMPNSMVIGGGLYKIVKRTFDKNYYFSKVGIYSIDDLIRYPVYAISNKSKTSNADTLSLYKNIL